MKRFLCRTSAAIVFLSFISVVISGQVVHGAGPYPDWQAGTPVSRVSSDYVTKAGIDRARSTCTARNVEISGYGQDELCVTEMKGWRYALYAHPYTQYGLTMYDHHFVISIGADTRMYVVEGLPGEAEPLGNPGSDILTYHTKGGQVFVYRDVLSSLARTDSGYSMRGKEPDSLHFNDGSAMVGGSIAVSRGGDWAVIETGQGIARADLTTGTVRLISPITTSYDRGYSPDVNLAVSEDGQTVFIGGRLYAERQFWVVSVQDGCGVVGSDSGVTSLCPALNLTGLFEDASLPDGWPIGLQMGAGGKRLDFYVERFDGAIHYTRASLYPYGSAPFRVRYLALGDSFSAGEGDTGRDASGASYYLPHTDDDASGDTCHLSSRSYPFGLSAIAGLEQFAGAITYPMKSVACSGALVGDVARGQSGYAGQDGRLAGRSAAELERLRAESLGSFIPGRINQMDFVDEYQPAAVSLSIGGNDVQFAQIISACVYSVITCDYASDPTDRRNLGESIGALYPKLTALYTDMARSDPAAHVYAVGYPRFINESNDLCPLTTSLDYGERQMIDQSVRYMNAVTRAAAYSAGIAYVNVEESFAGHRICDGPDPYANAIALFGQARVETFHPNAAGHDAMARTIVQQYGADLASASYCLSNEYPCPRAADPPTLPVYFGDMSVRPTYIALPSNLVSPTGSSLLLAITKTIEFTIQASLLLSGSTARMELHSEPIGLGNTIVRADGTLRASIKLPVSTPVGFHTIHVYAVTPSGEPADLYQVVYVQDASQAGTTQMDIPAQNTSQTGQHNDVSNTSTEESRINQGTFLGLLPATFGADLLLWIPLLIVTVGLLCLGGLRLLWHRRGS